LAVTAAVLQSVAVSPAPASVPAGLTQQFTATGHYSDNSTQTLTTSVTWSSSNTGIATINSSGLATGVVTGGPVTITAALSGISGTAQLTVNPVIPVSGTSCNGVYSGSFSGNISVSNGQSCIFLSGGVSGNVTVNGGVFSLRNTSVGGNVQATGGTLSVGPGSTITGDLEVQNVRSGTVLNEVCGATVKGNVGFQNNGVGAQIGSATPSSCGGNTISGNLQVQNNTAPTTIDGNRVGGNLQDQNNTALTQVFGNTVTGNLQCQNNSTITGGGNTAKQKQGQCAGF
jgi:hypothetical protein